MRARAGTFVRWCVEEHLGTEQAPALEAALRHHDSLLASGARPPELPRPIPRGPFAQEAWQGVRVSAARDALGSLEREARRRGVSVDRMLTHAFFVYLSALDSGALD